MSNNDMESVVFAAIKIAIKVKKNLLSHLQFSLTEPCSLSGIEMCSSDTLLLRF